MSEHRPEPHLPAPSMWPFVLGSGASLVAFGVLTAALFVIVGAVLFAIGLVGWIDELRNE